MRKWRENLSPEFRSRAFTLLEIIVVLAVISLLVSLLVPSLRIVKARSRAVHCSANLGSLGDAIAAFAVANDDHAAPALWQRDTNWNTEPQSGWDLTVGIWLGSQSGPRTIWQCSTQNTPFVGNTRALGVDITEHGGQRYVVPRNLWCEPARLVLAYDLQYNLLDGMYAHALKPSAADLSDEYSAWPADPMPLVSFWMPTWGPHNESYGVIFGDGHAESGTFTDGRAVRWSGQRWWPPDMPRPPVSAGITELESSEDEYTTVNCFRSLRIHFVCVNYNRPRRYHWQHAMRQ